MLLSDIDGLYDSDPRQNPDARLIHVVPELNDAVFALAGGKGSALGTGGMVTKLHAVEIAFQKKIPVVLGSAADPGILYDILEGSFTGTLFRPEERKEGEGR